MMTQEILIKGALDLPPRSQVEFISAMIYIATNRDMDKYSRIIEIIKEQPKTDVSEEPAA